MFGTYYYPTFEWWVRIEKTKGQIMLLKPMPGIPEDAIVTNQALIRRGGHNDRQKFWLEGHDDSESERTTITLVGESGIFYTYGGSASLLYTIIDGISIGVEEGV